MDRDESLARTAEDDRRPVRQVAYDRFRAALFDRSLVPGQFVSQRELTVLLGLSVGALRELLPRLQSEGLLSVLPQRGIQITRIDLPMIRDAFQMRMALEREAVLQAVRDMPDTLLDEQEAAHRDVVARVARDPSAQALETGQRVDDGFHALLVVRTRNDLLIQAHAVNAIRMRLIKLDRVTLSARVLPDAFADHLAVIAAIRARDAVKAMAAMDAHIHNARDRAVEI